MQSSTATARSHCRAPTAQCTSQAARQATLWPARLPFVRSTRVVPQQTAQPQRLHRPCTAHASTDGKHSAGTASSSSPALVHQVLEGCAAWSSKPQSSLALLVGLGAFLALTAAGPASADTLGDAASGIPQHHLVAADLDSLAAVDEFFDNVARYGRYFVSVMAGTAYIMVKPFAGLFKRPVTAILAVVGAVGLVWFVSFTVSAMLGITDPVAYEPRSLVIR